MRVIESYLFIDGDMGAKLLIKTASSLVAFRITRIFRSAAIGDSLSSVMQRPYQ